MKKSFRFTAVILSVLLFMTAWQSFAFSEAAAEDGLYTIGVSSSSDMFRVTKCVLRVEEGKMTGTLTLSGTGYGYLYSGNAAQAEAAPESEWIPFAQGFEGEYTYTLPISALDTDIAVAAYSSRKEKWYDRTLRFSSATLAPYDFVAPDGSYRVAVKSNSERLKEALCSLTVKNGEMTAVLSSLEDSISAFALAGDPITVEEGIISLPVASLDRKIPLRICVLGTWEDDWLLLDSGSVVPSAVACEDGVYSIDVDSDSGLFRVSACRLRVERGAMRAELTAENGNYDFMYMGPAADALADEGSWIPAITEADGTYTFVLDVPTLDNPVQIATHSRSKNMWYDRELTFVSETLNPSQDDAETVELPNEKSGEASGATSLADGEYIPDGFTFSGGTGKVAITCEKVVVSGGEAMATITFSSDKYTQVTVNGVSYAAIQNDGTASFEIPATLNADNNITGTTTAMSAAHDIDYVIRIELNAPKATSSGAPAIGGLVYESTMELMYAECFQVYRYGGGYSLIDIRNGSRYLVIPEGAKTPDGLPDDVVVLQKPIKNIYLAATSAMALFDSLDALDSLRLTGTAASGWYIEHAAEAMERGDILFAGKYSEPDFELLLRENCGLAIESTMILHSPNVQEMIKLLGIPVLIDRSSYETQPLGRTEWIKLYGVLTGKEDAADAFFARQAAIIDQLAGFENTGKTVAYFYISSDGSVVVRNSTDYVAKMIEIAGGKYAFSDVIGEEETRSSVSISMEEFYAAAVNADYLVYNATIDDPISNMNELLAKGGDMLSDFKAVREGNVWCTGKYLYQATDIIGNLIGDFHAMLTGREDGMTFLNKIN